MSNYVLYKIHSVFYAPVKVNLGAPYDSDGSVSPYMAL